LQKTLQNRGRWAWSAGLAAVQGGGSSEYALKAAFLFHFAQFVEWPDGSFRDAKSPYIYCTLGADPFEGALETVLNGKTVGERGFAVRHLKQAQEAQGCHLVFVGEEQGKQAASIVGMLNASPVLIVGESPRFVEQGGMIGFSLEDNKVRFEINLESAEKARFKISAKLLALAKTVIGGPKRGT
jgi:hypothetical protein